MNSLKSFGLACWYTLGIIALITLMLGVIYAGAFIHAKEYFQKHPEKLHESK